ncbi:hypothetical protein [Mobilicoccus massiliensis]|uniref:hypothetical protein n=1 Tax=Mobilicoccus massiliensis TaxID=1522310 RepID=UPI00058E79B0|nr:hypothetical protein [Mobilicoccus massiliensis]
MRTIDLDKQEPVPGLELVDPLPQWHIDMIRQTIGQAAPSHVNGAEPEWRCGGLRDKFNLMRLCDAYPSIKRRVEACRAKERRVLGKAA